jgi:hypothetical protein
MDVLAETSIELEARNLLANRLRRWSVEVGRDLLGMWTVEIEFGRIGSNGRRLRHVFLDQPAAHVYVVRGLRRRATARARIGVEYCCVRSSLGACEVLDRVGIDGSHSASR